MGQSKQADVQIDNHKGRTLIKKIQAHLQLQKELQQLHTQESMEPRNKNDLTYDVRKCPYAT